MRDFDVEDLNSISGCFAVLGAVLLRLVVTPFEALIFVFRNPLQAPLRLLQMPFMVLYFLGAAVVVLLVCVFRIVTLPVSQFVHRWLRKR